MNWIAFLLGCILFILLFGKRKQSGVFKVKINTRPFEPKHGEWSHLDVCISCEHPLLDNEVFYKSGRCVHCGYKHPHAATITETKDIPIRYSRVIHDWKLDENWDKKDEKLLKDIREEDGD